MDRSKVNRGIPSKGPELGNIPNRLGALRPTRDILIVVIEV